MRQILGIYKKCGKWLKKHRGSISSISSIASTVLVFLIGFQLVQAYSYKKFDNFLAFNAIYDKWYSDLPAILSKNCNASFAELDGTGQAWVKKYFNLYLQEYYFYKKKMIPKEMWEDLVHGCKNGRLHAAFSNFKKYPILLEGYCSWKHETDAFTFPDDFIDIFEKELQKCGISVKCTSIN